MKNTNPDSGPNSFNNTTRELGRPSLPTVESVMPLASFHGKLALAHSNHVVKCVNGSGGNWSSDSVPSVYSFRMKWRLLCIASVMLILV